MIEVNLIPEDRREYADRKRNRVERAASYMGREMERAEKYVLRKATNEWNLNVKLDELRHNATVEIFGKDLDDYHQGAKFEGKFWEKYNLRETRCAIPKSKSLVRGLMYSDPYEPQSPSLVRRLVGPFWQVYYGVVDNMAEARYNLNKAKVHAKYNIENLRADYDTGNASLKDRIQLARASFGDLLKDFGYTLEDSLDKTKTSVRYMGHKTKTFVGSALTPKPHNANLSMGGLHYNIQIILPRF